MTRTWPQAPAATGTEQRELEFRGTLAQRYAAWRATDEGALFFKRVQGAALLALRDQPSRLSIDWIWQDLRRKYRQSVDNSFRALAVRELTDLYPAMRGLFRMRRRTAA